MYLCYIDESGTPDIPGNTSHYVLTGFSIPIRHWKECDRQIETVKKKYDLENTEIHTAWILRPYLEQKRIPSFDSLDHTTRRIESERWRNAELLRLQRAKSPKHYKQTLKNFRFTAPYMHLSFTERKNFIKEVVTCISNWTFARLFSECVDKVYFSPQKMLCSIDEQAFEQVISRFEQYLCKIGKSSQVYGLLIHDNNETIAKKHTEIMKRFHQRGTFWTSIEHIIETPLFVNSQLTSMVQIADLCAYSIRRYLENNEDDLFNLIFKRADRIEKTAVGIRHFTKPGGCSCKICSSHRKT